MVRRKFLVTLCVVLWNPVYGSLIEVNETTFNIFPPLYALDDWSNCQRPGDVYCMVEAALTAPKTSGLLKLLQEYSKQTLKHYNRTLIHRGVCVTRCGTPDADSASWDPAAQICVNQSVAKYDIEEIMIGNRVRGNVNITSFMKNKCEGNLKMLSFGVALYILSDTCRQMAAQAQVLSVGWCTTKVNEEPFTHDTGSARALAVLCTLLVALACLATGLHVLGDRCGKVDGNKYLLAFSLKRNWNVLTYDRSKPRSDARMKDVACMEGIRFLGMQCVIFSHVLLIYIYSYIDNPEFVEKMYDQFGWQAVLNSPLWLQAFFSLSGFLTAYTVLISTSNNPITFYKCLMSIANRWIRLTPLAVFALWFTIAWFPLLGSGPQWAWVVQREAADCSERWWYHLLYVHNHLPTGKFCMGHTWYLAADMQLHILGVFLLLLFVKCRSATAPVLLTLTAGSAIAAGLVVYWNQLMPIITAQSPEILRTMFAGSKILTLVYLPSWMNLPGYMCGIATAFILHHTQTEGITKLRENKCFNIFFHLSLTLGGCVVFTGTIFLGDQPMPQWASVLYATLDRTLVAICFNVFLLGCFSRCTSAFRDLLDWRGFHILGRLSYCVFLIHFIVLRLTVAGNTQLGHASILALISLLITTSVLTYLASIPLCLLVELPALQLWKALTEAEPGRPVTSHPPAQPPIKPFDLVAHIRRLHDV